jgi:tetratricopeptide (TPR) repeat protein
MTIEQALDRAAQHHDAGDLNNAQLLYQRILQSEQNHPVAINVLGVIAFQQGKKDIAESYFSRAISIKPDYTDALYNLGNALKAQGRPEEAIARYGEAIALDPAHVDAHYNLGNVLKDMGRLEKALVHYRHAIDCQPEHADAHNNLGNTLNTLARLEEALPHYQKAIAIRPSYASAYYNLGTVLQALGRHTEAVPHYQKAIQLRPDLAVAYNNLGTALRSLERLDEAISHYQRAIALQPNFAEAHNNLGACYERTNRLEAAEQSNKKALRIIPDDQNSRLLKAVLLRRGGQDKEALHILESLDSARLSENFAVRRFFELGKLLDREQDSARAFKAFSAGNLLQAGSEVAARVSKTRYSSRIAAIYDSLSASWVDSWAPFSESDESDSPIFLIGFPRSGTTLLDQILDSHPRVQVMEERRAFASVVNAIQARPGGYPDALHALSEAEILKLRALYFESVDQHFTRMPGHFFVDKFPLNIEYLPLIHRLYPAARIILACRHPCDVVLSNFMQNYQLNDAMANFLTIADTVKLYKQVMTLWLRCTQLLPLNVHSVRYESLVSNFDPEVGDLFEFLDITWDDAVLKFHQHAVEKEIINTPSYEQVSQPLYTSACYRWQRYQDQLAPFMDDLAPLIEKFGYA